MQDRTHEILVRVGRAEATLSPGQIGGCQATHREAISGHLAAHVLAVALDTQGYLLRQILAAL
jgi:hypothetical protein